MKPLADSAGKRSSPTRATLPALSQGGRSSVAAWQAQSKITNILPILQANAIILLRTFQVKHAIVPLCTAFTKPETSARVGYEYSCS
jgi:hypothetical protein